MIVPFQRKTAQRGLSPCTGVCVMDEDKGWCKGCCRTLDEIALWSSLSLVEQRKVLLAVTHRRTPVPATTDDTARAAPVGDSKAPGDDV